VGFASLTQPFLKDYLVLLLHFCEYHSHAVSANIRHLTLSRKDCATVNDPEANLGASRKRFLRTYLAAESAEVGGLFADLAFRFHVDEINAGGERIPAGSGSLNQEVSLRRARAVCTY
jgi:hypothetical protein